MNTSKLTVREGTRIEKTLRILRARGPMTARQIADALGEKITDWVAANCSYLLRRGVIERIGAEFTKGGPPCTVYGVTEAGRAVQSHPSMVLQVLGVLENGGALTARQMAARLNEAPIQKTRVACRFLVGRGEVEKCGTAPGRIRNAAPENLYRITPLGIYRLGAAHAKKAMLSTATDTENRGWIATAQSARAARLARAMIEQRRAA